MEELARRIEDAEVKYGHKKKKRNRNKKETG
jgi:hypothetical protein